MKLIATRLPYSPAAAVVVLHGGGSRGHGVPVSPTQLSVVRMIPIARRIADAGGGRLAVWRLLNSVRGWDATLADVRAALRQLRAQLPPGTPVGLVGHSLGGRAAIRSAGADGVRSVVALAPWVHEYDGDVDAAGRQVLIVYGTADRVASPRRALAVADRLTRTAQVGVIGVRGGKHAMLRRHSTFEGLAAEFMVATLLGRPVAEPSGPLAEALAGGSPVFV